MDRCKTCEHFKRDQYHEAIGGGDQPGGKCQRIQNVLGMSNFGIYRLAFVHVYESFGCIAHEHKPTSSEDETIYPVCVECGGMESCKCG